MRMRSFLSHFPAIALTAVLIFKIGDSAYIYAHAEAAADPKSGHTIEIPMHGRSVFITPDQMDRLGLFNWTNLVFLALTALVVVQKVRKQQQQ